MAIWLRAREEFADNRFQLLFIYVDTQWLYIGPVTGRPFPWLLVRQLVMCKAQIASANQIHAFTLCVLPLLIEEIKLLNRIHLRG